MMRLVARLFLKIASLTGVILAALVMYIPFRLVAQKYNIVFPGGSDDFYHWFSVALWPAYALLFAFMVHCAAQAIKIRWYGHILLLIVALTVWDSSPTIDDLLSIEGGGLNGFKSYPTNYGGNNTVKLSVMACPFAFLSGALAGILGGKRVFRSDRVKVEGRCVKCGYDLTGNISGVCPECGERIRSVDAEI